MIIIAFIKIVIAYTLGLLSVRHCSKRFTGRNTWSPHGESMGCEVL